MKLHTSLVPVGLSSLPRFDSLHCQPSTWVRLCEPISPYSFDEALLLCQEIDGHWVAWVPDFGETRLSPTQFYRLD